MDKWKRARTDDQIRIRVQQILEAAAEMFRNLPYEDVTMMKIASRAGFTRSNIYRYFTTREEIFLTLYLEDSRKWKIDIAESLESDMTPGDFISLWMDILERHPRFLELTPLLNLSLERNSSREVLLETKMHFGTMISELSPLISRALPQLTDHRINEFLQTNLFLIAGTWPAAHRTEMQESVIDELGAQELKVDFYEFLGRSLATCLRGLGA